MVPTTKNRADREIAVIVDRLASPLQDAADALHSLAVSVRLFVALEQERFKKEFPHLDIKPAFVGVAKYPEPKKDKPEEEGDIFPEQKTDRWAGIGPRERKAIEKEERLTRQQEKERRSAPKARRKA